MTIFIYRDVITCLPKCVQLKRILDLRGTFLKLCEKKVWASNRPPKREKYIIGGILRS